MSDVDFDALSIRLRTRSLYEAGREALAAGKMLRRESDGRWYVEGTTDYVGGSVAMQRLLDDGLAVMSGDKMTAMPRLRRDCSGS